MTSDDDRLERLLRAGGDLDGMPPEKVWRAIRQQLGRDEDVRATTSATARPSDRQRADRAGGRRVIPLLLAAAAGAALVYAGVQLTGDGQDTVEGAVVAEGELGPVEGEGRLGEAEVLDRDGRRVLRLQLDQLPDAGDGYLEVWLLRPDVSGLVTLGVLDSATEEFVLPEGLDLGEYPVVDVSVEHLDGDPAHGGDSRLRGEVR